jgi:aminobenzoyl-glutamate utilization protein B
MEKIAAGAALMTDTAVEIQVDSDTHELVPNRPLSELIQENLELVGAPRFSEAEKEFARRTQIPLEEARGEPIAAPLSEKIEALEAEPGLIKASTDVGDVSWVVPTGGLRVASYTFGAPGHSWQIVACTGTSIGEKGMLVAAKVLSATALDLLHRPEVIDRAREDFQKRREGIPYTTLVPKEQKPPASIR